MIKNTLFRICLALILIPALMLSGCSKKGDTAGTDVTVESKDAGTGSGHSLPSSGGRSETTTGVPSTNGSDISTGSVKESLDAKGESKTGSSYDIGTTGTTDSSFATGSEGAAGSSFGSGSESAVGGTYGGTAEEAGGSSDISWAVEPATSPIWSGAGAGDGAITEYSLDIAGSALLKSRSGLTDDIAYGEGGLSDWSISDGWTGADRDDVFDGEPWVSDDDILPEEPYIQPVAGLLTSGEWNDNLHFDFLKNLINNGQQQDYSSFFKAWDFTPFSRIAVHVSCGETTVVSGTAIGINNVCNADVTAFTAKGRQIWHSKTDSKGMTYIFYRLNGGDDIPAYIKVITDDNIADVPVTSQDLLDSSVMEIVFGASAANNKKLDLMFMIDTTGSMGDEILYLQKELEDVIQRVKQQNANLPVRLSCNFYRDLTDDYIVRSNDFSENISTQLMYLNAEQALGGGDYEEAVELALEDAVNNHSWDSDSIKLMFLVLDAPPHNTDEIKAQLASTLQDAIAQGIRIIPVASSGVDKSTEFLLRTFAMTTGGTYTFLTDDSGIGGSHIEPTIGDYEVENLNDMLVRIISEYLH
ncbi:MAG: VWA domain-containing protein [Lachnospiraceae bacterium]|nr:VWA domain-containing protein [Lachnospiraceae bacterium]